MSFLILRLIVIGFNYAILVRADIFPECDGIPSKEFVASPNSCEAFIYCDGENSAEGQCPPGLLFNAATKVCDDEKNVDCYIGKSTSTTTDTAITTTIKTSTRTTTTTTVTATTTTTSPAITTTQMPMTSSTKTQTTSFGTTKGIEIYTTTSWAPPVATLEKCPEYDDPSRLVYIPSSDSCSDYYICYHGQKVQMSCADYLHFNPKLSQCDYPQNVKCSNKRPNAKDCQAHVVDLYPHPNRCEYFYYCQHGFLKLQQCPFYYGWDFEKRTCLPKNLAKCYNKVIS